MLSCWHDAGLRRTDIYTSFIYPFENDPLHVTGEPSRDWTACEERDSEVPDAWA